MRYAGIGARATPPDVLEEMKKIALHLQPTYTLRSGGAKGADSAFESGAGYNKEIFIPWSGFNGSDAPFVKPSGKVTAVARKHHPYWEKLSYSTRRLMERNVMIILGEDLKTRVDFVVCWTPDGMDSGGTGHAIRVAEAYRIPVYNLRNKGFDYDFYTNG